jgi:hypothetical protein
MPFATNEVGGSCRKPTLQEIPNSVAIVDHRRGDSRRDTVPGMASPFEGGAFAYIFMYFLTIIDKYFGRL